MTNVFMASRLILTTVKSGVSRNTETVFDTNKAIRSAQTMKIMTRNAFL